MSQLAVVPLSASVRCARCVRQRPEDGTAQRAHSRGLDLHKHQRTPQPAGWDHGSKVSYFQSKQHPQRQGGKKKKKEIKGGRTQSGLAPSLWALCCLFSRAELVPPCRIIPDAWAAAAALCRAPTPGSGVAQFIYKAPEPKGARTVRKLSSEAQV